MTPMSQGGFSMETKASRDCITPNQENICNLLYFSISTYLIAWRNNQFFHWRSWFYVLLSSCQSLYVNKKSFYKQFFTVLQIFKDKICFWWTCIGLKKLKPFFQKTFEAQFFKEKVFWEKKKNGNQNQIFILTYMIYNFLSFPSQNIYFFQIWFLFTKKKKKKNVKNILFPIYF